MATSSSGKSGAGGIILWIIIIAVVAYVAHHFYTEWVDTESMKSAQQLETELLQTTARFKNADGYVNESDVEAYQKAAYDCVRNYKGGKIKSKGKTNNGVWVEFDNGFTMFAEPPLEDYLNADTSGSCRVDEFKPCEFSARGERSYSLIYGDSSTYASVFADGHAFLTSYGSVNLSAVNGMGVRNTQQIILWTGHGAYTSDNGCYLVLGEKVKLGSFNSKSNKYGDYDKSMLGYTVEGGYIAVNSEFIKEHVHNLDGALVYLGACNSGHDRKLANAFIAAGADTVICYSDTTRLSYHVELSHAFTEAMCTKDANGKYPTVSQAMETAKSKAGENDSSKGGVGSRPVIVGSQSYTFKSRSGGGNTGNTGGGTNGGTTGGTTGGGNTGGTTNGGNTGGNTGGTTNGGTTNGGNTGGNTGGGTTNGGNNGGQTAPMPDHPISESQIIGKWSPDVDADQPEYIEFFYENGQLRYYWYIVVRGNGNGFNIANETTEYEINSGYVAFHGNQGRCECINELASGRGSIGFYLFNIDSGYIQRQENGDIYYRVE